MARDYEGIHDIENLSDRELRDLVRNHFTASSALDPDDITVQVNDGLVVLEGRVGDTNELQIAEHILTDVLGVRRYRNDLVVDYMRRAESPEAIDDHLADEDR